MADFTSFPGAGGFDVNSTEFDTSTPRVNRLKTLTNFSGAMISLVLVAGVAVWGYKLLVRDVSGIPVVRAAIGEMRERPANPGGQLAQHQGLAVNAVASEGAASEHADALRLAPKPVELQDEDVPSQEVDVAAMPQVDPAAAAQTPGQTGPIIDAAAALQSGDMNDLVAQLTDGVDLMASEDLLSDDSADAEVADAAMPAIHNALFEAPGVRQSLRPKHRPAAPARIITASATPEPVPEIDAAALPVGTHLAQLGAFDSAEVASAQWDQANQRFGAYLEGKTRVIQKASSGGRVFYRLRAMGFEDLSDARRFCSALVAENADCIPVISR